MGDGSREFKGTGAIQCGRCQGSGVCRTCNGDGSRKPTPAYLEKRRLEIARFATSPYERDRLDTAAKWPEQWMPCNACEQQSGICAACKGSGWVKVEPVSFGIGIGSKETKE